MSDSGQTVLEFLSKPPKELPIKITVQRSAQSKYLFLLVNRLYQRRLKETSRFVTYAKKEVMEIKGGMEEFPLWGQDIVRLFAMEGFYFRFIADLSLPPNTYVVAETDGGELKTEPFVAKLRRDVLRVLLKDLNLPHLSLRALLQLDWSVCRRYEDFEPILREAKLAEWDEEQIGKRLEKREKGKGGILTLLKRGQWKQLFAMKERYGPIWCHRHIIEETANLIHYRLLRQMGLDEIRTRRELDLGWGRAKQTEEAYGMVTGGDLETLASQVVRLDHMFWRNPSLAFDWLLLTTALKPGR